MGAERVFNRLPVHHQRAGPAFGRLQNQHRPGRCALLYARPGLLLNSDNFPVRPVHRLPHGRVNLRRVAAAHDTNLVAVAGEQVSQGLVAHAPKQGGAGEFVAIDVQNRQHRPRRSRVEVIIGMPGSSQRTGFGFAIANDAGHQQVGVVEGGSIGMGEAIAQFAPLLNLTGCAGYEVTRQTEGPRKRPDQVAYTRHARLVLRVEFTQSTFQKQVGKVGGCAVTRPRHQQNAGIGILHKPVQVGINQVQARRGSPMPQ